MDSTAEVVFYLEETHLLHFNGNHAVCSFSEKKYDVSYVEKSGNEVKLLGIGEI